MADIYKSGLLYVRDGRMLLCRRKPPKSQLLILPGGKLERGETPEDCLHRECREELGEVTLTSLKKIGTYESPAAGNENKTVRIDLYTADVAGTPTPHSEIAELVWFHLETNDRNSLAPSLKNSIIPDLQQRNLL